MAQVPTIRTPHTGSEIAESLIVAFERKYGAKPSRNLAAYLWGLIMLETAGGSALWNENPGNVTIANPDQDYFLLKNKQGTFNKERYRNFERLDLGLENFLYETVTRRPSLIAAAEAGDAYAFATAIRVTRYTPSLDVESHYGSYKKLAEQAIAAGYFAAMPESTLISKPSTPSGSPTSASKAGSGAALFIMAGTVGIFWATMRIKPGRKSLA
jgi:hypothetical protein